MEITDFSLKCKCCGLSILDVESPKGWCGGERIEIEHIDKDIDFCLTCLNMIRNTEGNILIVNENFWGYN